MDKKPISFAEAAQDLEALCEKIDEIEDVGPIIQQMFTRAQDDLKATVDRRIKFLKYAESQMTMAKKMRDQWGDRAQRFEKTIEYIKNDTLQTMKLNPNLPYRGSIGGFKVFRNSQPSIIYTDDFIPAEYIEESIVVTTNKEKLRKDLLEGKEIPGCKLQYGEHIRVSLDV